MYNLCGRFFQVFSEDEQNKKVKVLRKITKQRLKNIALYYLKRFDSSVANLRSVLMRRVNDYAYQNQDFDKGEAIGWINELLKDFQEYGYLDDRRYSEIKIRGYIAAGKAPRYIKGKLREKGIDEDVVEEFLDNEEYNPVEAAMKLAKKRKLGPYRHDEEERKANRQKDMAKLVQAGFDYDTVVHILSVKFEE